MTASSRPRKCRSCRAPIRWVRTAGGKWMPLDPDPSPRRGTVVLTDDLLGADPVAHVFGPDAAAAASLKGETLYVSHFSTCPHADEHRRGA